MMRIFLSSFFVFGCAQYPKVTLNRIDNKKNIVYPYKVKKYNLETCELEFERKAPISLFDESLNGGVLISIDDYKRLQSKAKADCLNERD